jgi:hypothetical protein
VFHGRPVDSSVQTEETENHTTENVVQTNEKANPQIVPVGFRMDFQLEQAVVDMPCVGEQAMDSLIQVEHPEKGPQVDAIIQNNQQGEFFLRNNCGNLIDFCQ